MANPGTPDNPLRVAVIGSGPAAFYATVDLLKDGGPEARVDMFDRLPTPFGLVRAGVAPDHPKIKNVIKIYEKAAANPNFRFFGNVTVGSDISHADLARSYHAVIYGVGAQTDRHMGIPGEDLPGSHPATAFVAWYNAHPDFADEQFNLDVERAVIIGNGNVAMDVARMLSVSREQISKTDVADHAIEPLTSSSLKEVLVVGRRGPAQAAFTNPELLELPELTVADVHVDPAEAALDELSQRQLDEGLLDKTRRRNVEILQEYAAAASSGRDKRISLRFLLSPEEIRGNGRVEEIVLARNELYRDGDGQIRARETGEHETVPCGLVLRSIGYRGVPIEGVPFDEWKGTIPNDRGMVLNTESQEHIPGLYAVGWIKRGPSGVIGTNKRDAQETVAILLDELAEGRLPEPEEPNRDALDALIAERVPDLVTYAGWQAIDAAEVAAGEPQGRPRVKFATWDGLVGASRG
ncbi:MAG: ferredoxin/flavodoxin---NADP+ reductase [Thermoleophilaceae bacterium]|jgi:ferredoxin--NADP+ reductase|nr:ferredoxin/flavodoxin---NADP+ reductase [Thermoleophilaceae bacterium]